MSNGSKVELTPWMQSLLQEVNSAITSGEELHDLCIGSNGSSDNDGDPSAVCLSIDALCAEVGIDQQDWDENFVSGNVDQEAMHKVKAAAARRRGWTVGQFVTRLAYDALPIEEGIEGLGATTLSLRCGDTHELNLYSEGDYWTEVSADDPEYGEIEHAITYTAALVLAKPAATS
jgi:hypothetical protein